MKFFGLSEEGSRDAGGHIITYFGIPVGQEEAAGRDLLACLTDGFEVSLCNDLDEGLEGTTQFMLLPSGLVTKVGGHGWSSQWKPTDEAGFLSAVTELANLNRGGDWSRQGSLSRSKYPERAISTIKYPEQAISTRTEQTESHCPMKRNRLLYGAFEVGVIATGWGTRRYGRHLPELVAVYGGDTFWALMVFVGIGLIARTWSTKRVAALALAVSYGVEISQLYHAGWIDQLRHSVVGGLVLGRGFVWSDLVCYTVGVGLGVAAETLWYRRHRPASSDSELSERANTGAGVDHAG
jgi:hypothetical protein